MGTFYALLVLCEGNPPVTGRFSSQRPVTRSFDAFFDVRLNKRLSKKISRLRWFETPWRSSWRHCNADIYFSSSHRGSLRQKPRGRRRWHVVGYLINNLIRDVVEKPTCSPCDWPWLYIGRKYLLKVNTDGFPCVIRYTCIYSTKRLDFLTKICHNNTNIWTL